MFHYISIDIGGTQIRAGCYPEGSITPVRLSRIATRQPLETALERMLELVASIWPEDGQVRSIGVAAPGPVDPYRGILRDAPNIPGWDNVPLRQILEERFGVRTALGNDANLAAMGEWKYGAGIGHHNLVYVTVSTGIGGGVIVDDRLLLGAHGLAGEIGHVTVDIHGPMCGCGHRGHIEALASGTAMARWVTEQVANGAASILSTSDRISGKLIYEAAIQRDPLALEAFQRTGTFLGAAFADFLHIFNPSILIIGGGVSRAGEYLFAPLREAMAASVITPYYLEDLTLTTASLGDEAGLMGGLALAHDIADLPPLEFNPLNLDR
jgi:glucokinase